MVFETESKKQQQKTQLKGTTETSTEIKTDWYQQLSKRQRTDFTAISLTIINFLDLVNNIPQHYHCSLQISN